MIVEGCGFGEFECSNGVCVSVDSVCDGQDDCWDNTDEINCGNYFVSHSATSMC